MIAGVTDGFKKILLIDGVGFKAEVKGKDLVMLLGFSHPVNMPIPEGISAKTKSATELHIEGTSKQMVGHFAASIRALYKPEPYKGKGVRYSDEVIRRKAGKSVVK